ncbi:hypothetical protein BGZ49_003833 [Haplosporangium sp. Z 27]|nr:hypothetical protein BGZ49_003833 [Haplosporangium sp. Z 27]
MAYNNNSRQRQQNAWQRNQLFGETNSPLSSGRNTPYDPTRMSDREIHSLESQNDEELSGLHSKVAMLKKITLDIGQEVRDSTLFIGELDQDFGRTGGLLNTTYTKLKVMASTQNGRYMCYMLQSHCPKQLLGENSLQYCKILYKNYIDGAIFRQNLPYAPFLLINKTKKYTLLPLSTMTFAILKITSALLVVACAVQAAPIVERSCVGDACNQSIRSGNVNLGSTTNIVPVTQVVPITRYQPIVQSYAPIVQSETSCDDDNLYDTQYLSPSYGNYMHYRQGSDADMMMMPPYDHFRYNMDRFDMGHYNSFDRLPYMDRMNNWRFDRDNTRFNSNNRNFNRVNKRDVAKSDEEDQMNMHNVKSDCVPSETDSCEQSLPVSTTDMGSYVTVKPTNAILPSTVYQGHVKSESAEIDAAPAQYSSLSRSHVNLGSNTMIEPVTKVLPHTTYQPSVSQKATTIEAVGPSDQSLARSSVSMGSSVTIRPTTFVEPQTIFQPSIQSLPFVISDEGCA